MLTHRHRIIFYSFVSIILLIACAAFIVKYGNLFDGYSKEKPGKDQIMAGGREENYPIPIKTVSEAGAMAPDFTFPDMNGKPVSLSQHRGKVVFLNIWATWCGPCRIEMPAMEKLYQKFKKKDFVILAISIDRQRESVVRPFINELGITFPVLLSPDGSIQKMYMVNALPASFIINKSGLIVAEIIGARDWFGPKTIETFESLISET